MNYLRSSSHDAWPLWVSSQPGFITKTSLDLVREGSFPFCCLPSWRRADKRHRTGHLRVAGYFLGRYAEGTGAHVRGILSYIPHHCCSGGTRAGCPASWLVLYIIYTHRHIHVCIYRHFPGGPVAETPCSPCRGPQVQSLVRELDLTCCN